MPLLHVTAHKLRQPTLASASVNRERTPLPDRAVYEAAIRDAVRAYPDDCVEVSEGRNEADSDVWGMEVQPTNPTAAPVYVSYWGTDEVDLGFGETHLYVWDADPAALAEEIQEVLGAVFAGEVEESGVPGDSTARIVTPSGRRLTVGSVSLPIPWRWRRVRRYAPLA